MNAIVDFFRKLFGTDSTPEPDPVDPCKALACVNAKNKLNTARSKFNGICNALRMLSAIARALQQVLSAPLWVLIAIAVVAVIVGGLIALILLALIAAYALSWVLLPVIQLTALSLAAELNKQRTKFIEASDEVKAQCPENCRGDLSIPQCQLE
jgi:hypothetical protein